MSEVVLSVQGVSKSFGDRRVHDNVSFDVRRGEILGLMGPSGGGKSLILKIIIGLVRPDSGRVHFDREDICSLKESDLYHVRTRIGYVFQSGALFDSMTVEENLSYPLQKHTRKSPEEIAQVVRQRLRLVDLAGTEELYPAQLSGGMQKRAGLARATILDPSVVLFDEPTAGLDPINIRRLVYRVNYIRKSRNLSGIFVSHDFSSLAAVSDRVAFLWDSRIHAIGTVDEIRISPDPVIQSFVNTDYRAEGLLNGRSEV